MSKFFTPDEIRRKGYIRYPKIFLDLLLRDYNKGPKNSVATGIMLDLYSRAAYSAYQHQWQGMQFTIHKGQCIVKIPELANRLGCSVYAIRKGLDFLVQKNVVVKRKLPRGLAVEIVGYQDFLFKGDHAEPDNQE